MGAIKELQNAGVEPDVWKIEGLENREDCVKIAEVVKRDGRSDVGCILLGRGSNATRVVEWLRTAVSVPGFIGFAVGRNSFGIPSSRSVTVRCHGSKPWKALPNAM